MARKTGKREEGPFTSIGAAKELKGRWGEGAAGKETIKADWASIDPVLLHSLISQVGYLGGAVTLGVDKSGAGFTVAVWVGGEKVYNQWFSGSQEGIDNLHVQVEMFTEDVRALLKAH